MSVTFTTKAADVAGFELNVANLNAGLIIEMCGFTPDKDDPSCGTADFTKLPSAIFGCVDVLENLSSYARPSGEMFGKKGCRIIDCGLSEEQVRSYCHRMIKLMTFALVQQSNIVWY